MSIPNQNCLIHPRCLHLKTELVYRKKFKSREEAMQEIFEWIETWYNKKRLHSALNYLTPEEYEEMALAG